MNTVKLPGEAVKGARNGRFDKDNKMCNNCVLCRLMYMGRPAECGQWFRRRNDAGADGGAYCGSWRGKSMFA